jgi:drug/metabolite transporter (DMT)-like permease
MRKISLKILLILNGLFILYSCAGIFSKLASSNNFFSLPFFIFYGLVLVILLIYALVWQQLLKKLPLTVMYANKSIVMVFGLLWGAFLFSEQLKWGMIIGVPLIVVGIWLVVMDDE